MILNKLVYNVKYFVKIKFFYDPLVKNKPKDLKVAKNT